MIVRQFLQWVRTAPAGERAEAASALARAFLFSDLPITDRVAVEAAMVRLLDDVSPLVRAALAETLAASADAPAAVIHALSMPGGKDPIFTAPAACSGGWSSAC